MSCGLKTLFDNPPQLHITACEWYLSCLTACACVCAHLSLSVELELSWFCVSKGWKEVEADAPVVQRADGQSEDASMLRLHCADKPRAVGGPHAVQLHFPEKAQWLQKGFANTLTWLIVQCLVSEWLQLLKDLVHGLFFVLEFLELSEFGTRSCCLRI